MSKRKNTPPSQPSISRNRTSCNTTMTKTIDDVWERLIKLDKLDSIEEKVNVIESKYELFTNKQQELEGKINSNRDYIVNLHYTLDKVQLKLSHLERAKICSNLIVNGLPNQEQEDTTQLILTLCGALQIPIEAKVITSCRRMIVKKGIPPIVVSLIDEGTKIKIYKKWKEINKNGSHPLKNQLIKDLYDKFQITNTSYISIVEEDTKYTYNLYKEAKERLKDICKYVWKRNGNIFAKSDDNSKGIKITSSHHIDEIICDHDNNQQDGARSLAPHDMSFMSTKSSY